MNSLLLVVASNLAVACCIAVVAYGVGRWGRSAALTHLLWVAVFVKLITPPIVVAPVTVPSGWDSPLETVYRVLVVASREPTVAEIAGQASFDPSDIKVPHSIIAAPSGIMNSLQQITLTRFLVTIWLMGMSLIFMRGVLRFSQFSRLLVRDGTIDHEATSVVVRLVAGRRKNVPMVRRISARVSPMLFGVGRATCIVCPNRLWDQLTSVQRETFLAHEVAHFLRRDHWVRWLE